MANITAAVGAQGAVNQHADVEEVQTLLDVVSPTDGGPATAIDIDGWCGQNTNRAILNFQRVQKFAVQDGRVDPAKTTIKRLNELASGPSTRTVALPDLDPAQLAIQSIQLSSVWARAGLAAAQGALDQVRTSGSLAGRDSIELTALAGHFKLADVLGKSRLEKLLTVVVQNYTATLGVFGNAAVVFRTVTRKQMSIDFGGQPGAPGYVLPLNRTRINWSPLFRIRSSGQRPGRDWTGEGFGPKCRAAMVLHEPIHMVDAVGGHDIYEHGAQYATMSPDTAVHNAASYPSFGAHVAEHSSEPLGPLYGAGKPAI